MALVTRNVYLCQTLTATSRIITGSSKRLRVHNSSADYLRPNMSFTYRTYFDIKNRRSFLSLLPKRYLSSSSGKKQTKTAALISTSLVPNKIATACGHAAFVLTGLAFVTTDILQLRLVALGGITTSMIFQYFRPQPLMLPLKWNALFFSINVVMASLLVHERMEADDMDDELVSMYQDGSFAPRGFDKVEFYRLFSLAKKQEKKQGDFLEKIGTSNNTLYYIEKGSASLIRDETVLAYISENDFSGEMSLISSLTSPMKKDSKDKDNSFIDETGNSNNNDDDDDISMIAKSDVIVNSPTMIVWYWDIEELRKMLRKPKNRGVANALLAYASHELREKLIDSWDIRMQQQQDQREIEQVAVNYLLNGALSKNDEKRMTSNTQ